jgi:hypothetical protein
MSSEARGTCARERSIRPEHESRSPSHATGETEKGEKKGRKIQYTFAERPETRNPPVPRDSCRDDGIWINIEKDRDKVLEFLSLVNDPNDLLLSFSVHKHPVYRIANDRNLIVEGQ